MDTPETFAAVVPVLATVTVWVALVAPTTVLRNDSEPGLAPRMGPGASPVPDSGTALADPLAVTDRVPVRLPAAVGANFTETVHEAPAASDVPHVLVWLKSPV